MNKFIKIFIIFLIIDIVLIAGYLIYKEFLSGKPSADQLEYDWVTIDEYYTPKSYVEEFIKNDSAQKNLLPVYIRNYGKDPAILRKFSGSNFAKPNKAQLNMMYNGLEDWMLIDLKYKTKQDKEITRTILYILLDGTWRVGDSGTLLK